MQTTLGAHSMQRLLTSISSRQVTLSRWVFVLLLVVIAWQLGKAVTTFVEPAQPIPAWTPAVTQSTNNLSDNQSSIANIVDANLFGQYQREVVAEKQEVKDAPKTRLNLILVGVVSSSDPAKSLAVVSNSGAQETVGVDEMITGTRAKVVSVLPDRIIIENAGRDETLMLEGIDYRQASAASTPAQPSRAQSNVISNNADVADLGDLDAIKQAILENPQQFLKYIRLSQVNRDGELFGYRVRPGRERALFDSVGLQDGDLAVELNGIDLTDKSAMGSIMQSFNEMTEVNLTVERDSQRYDIYIQF
jgi:general secretion pathway protein C